MKTCHVPTDLERTDVLKIGVLGWIADSDKDTAGEPGFVSESTGKPACLFHVKFDSSSAIDSQDYEAYELEGRWI